MKRITIGFLLASFFAAVLADVVELKNGDRLSGRIEGLSKGKLTFSTDYAGKIQIDWKKVAKLSSEERMVAEFASGRSAVGVITSRRNGTAYVAAEQPQSVDLAEIVSIRQDPTLAEKRSLLHEWRGSVDFGYSVTAGNTEVKNFSLNFTPERRTEADRIQLKLQSLYSVQDGVAGRSLYKSSIRYDRYLGPQAFVFAIGLMEKDERKSLALRASEGGGFGVRLRPNVKTRMSFYGGATFLQEDFETTSRNLGGEALAGLEIETRSFSPFVVTAKNQILPSLGEGRYRVEWDAHVRVPLFSGLTLGLQLFDYFDSDPPKSRIKRNDFGVLSTLGLTF